MESVMSIELVLCVIALCGIVLTFMLYIYNYQYQHYPVKTLYSPPEIPYKPGWYLREERKPRSSNKKYTVVDGYKIEEKTLKVLNNLMDHAENYGMYRRYGYFDNELTRSDILKQAITAL